MSRRRESGTRAVAATMAVAIAALGAACSPGPVGVASLPPNGLVNNLLAHWSFDEGAPGFMVLDSSGNEHHGLITGNSWRPMYDGKFGAALHLGGSDPFGSGSSVTVGGFPQAPSAFTVSAWYRLATNDVTPALSETMALLSNELLGGGGWALNLELPPPPGNNDANYQFTYSTPPPVIDVRAECLCLSLDVWMHIAAVVDAVPGGPGTLTMYVDGVERMRVDVPVAIPRGLQTLYIGRLPGLARFVTGDLDDIAVWTRALVPAEIALLGTTPVPNPI
jgi:hypothetical protein